MALPPSHVLWEGAGVANPRGPRGRLTEAFTNLGQGRTLGRWLPDQTPAPAAHVCLPASGRNQQTLKYVTTSQHTPTCFQHLTNNEADPIHKADVRESEAWW